MEPQRFDDIDSVIAFAKSLPDFPNKAFVVERLEMRNVNRYQEAMGSLNETLASNPNPDEACTGGAATGSQIQELVNRIARLEASDPVGG